MRRMSMAAVAAALLASISAASPPSGYEFGTLAQLAGPTILEPGTTVVPVRLTRKDHPTGTAGAELQIVDLVFDAPPGVQYEVSLRAPNGRRAALGVVNFYNETAPGYAQTGIPGRTFDATKALRRLGGEVNALVFEPTAGVAGPGVHVRVNPAARVRFASVAIRWR